MEVLKSELAWNILGAQGAAPSARHAGVHEWRRGGRGWGEEVAIVMYHPA